MARGKDPSDFEKRLSSGLKKAEVANKKWYALFESSFTMFSASVT